MNSWVFLAKSCWTANAQGSMDVTIKYTSWNCSNGNGCYPGQNVSTPDKLPQIMFYSSYDEKFSQSVLKSYTTNSFGEADSSDSDRPCFGNSAVYKEKIGCTQSSTSMVRAQLHKRGPGTRTLFARGAHSTWRNRKERTRRRDSDRGVVVELFQP
jgi:hypothetical protein